MIVAWFQALHLALQSNFIKISFLRSNLKFLVSRGRQYIGRHLYLYSGLCASWINFCHLPNFGRSLSVISFVVSVIDSIPSFRYSASSRDSSNGNCVVCMSDYINREKLRRLPCNHDFHAKCIDRWLKVRFANHKFISSAANVIRTNHCVVKTWEAY